MRTDRVRNVTLHEQAWAAVSAALGRDLEETEVT
jgi:hypothetical protein